MINRREAIAAAIGAAGAAVLPAGTPYRPSWRVPYITKIEKRLGGSGQWYYWATDRYGKVFEIGKEHYDMFCRFLYPWVKQGYSYSCLTTIGCEIRKLTNATTVRAHPGQLREGWEAFEEGQEVGGDDV